METNATKRTDLFWIDPRNIDIQEGFNVRREFDLDELKELKSQGKNLVITGDYNIAHHPIDVYNPKKGCKT